MKTDNAPPPTDPPEADKPAGAGCMARLVRPFFADRAPLGTIVQVGSSSPDERIARSEFHRYLFQYFENLTSGKTGWGIDFHEWLEITRGWKHLGRRKYERIMSIREAVDYSETNAKHVRPIPKKPLTRNENHARAKSR